MEEAIQVKPQVKQRLFAADCRIEIDPDTKEIIKVRYRLWREKEDLQRRYMIGIITDTEKIKRQIATRRQDAIEFYKKIVDGFVTPMTLDDIIADNIPPAK